MNLKAKYSLVVSAVILFVILSLSFPIIWQVKEAVKTQIELRGISLSRHFSLEAKTFIKDVNLQPLAALKEEPDVKDAMICDTENEILAQLYPGKGGMKIGSKLTIEETSGLSPNKTQPASHFQEVFYSNENTYIYVFDTPILDKEKILGTFYLFLSKDKIDAAINKAARTILIIAVISLLAGITLSISFLDAVVTNPIVSLIKDTHIIGEGNLDHYVSIRKADEIGKLGASFNEMTKRLKKTRSELLAKQRIEADINIARSIQENLLPKEVPSLAGVELAAFYKSAKEVGGDYYDFFFVDEEKKKLGIVIADVSGKSIPGCIIMAMTRSVLHSQAKLTLSAADVLIKTNATIYEDIQRGMFITAIYCILDLETNILTFADAGHNPMLLYNKKMQRCEFVNAGGMALGFDGGKIFNKMTINRTLNLSSGDVLVLYTDGVTEAMNIAREEFGENKLLKIITENISCPPREILTAIDKQLKDFTGNIEQHDDITMAVIKIK